MATLSTEGLNRGGLKPKEWHDQFLAKADRERIVQHLEAGREQDVTNIAVTLARHCALLVHFQRLWTMRVSELDHEVSSEAYMRNIYVNKNVLYKELFKSARR